jgi:hypothetical protein
MLYPGKSGILIPPPARRTARRRRLWDTTTCKNEEMKQAKPPQRISAASGADTHQVPDTNLSIGQMYCRPVL